MEFIYEYGLFLAQAVTLVAAILIVVAGLVSLGQRQKAELHEGHIEVRNLNEKYRQISDSIQHMVSDPDEFKAAHKQEKKAEKPQAYFSYKNAKKSDKAVQINAIEEELNNDSQTIVQRLKTGSGNSRRREIRGAILR